MGLIWQEFKAIVIDAWDKIVLWADLLRAGIAAKKQLLIVSAIGLPISGALICTPIWALLDFTFGRVAQVFGERARPPLFGGSFTGYVLMFCLGSLALWFTAELGRRIEKRLEGKSKDDSPIRPGEEVIEVIEALRTAAPESED